MVRNENVKGYNSFQQLVENADDHGGKSIWVGKTDTGISVMTL
jgi:hypothetical protein